MAGEMAQYGISTCCYSDELSLIPWSQMVEVEEFPKVVLWSPQVFKRISKMTYYLH